MVIVDAIHATEGKRTRHHHAHRRPRAAMEKRVAEEGEMLSPTELYHPTQGRAGSEASFDGVMSIQDEIDARNHHSKVKLPKRTSSNEVAGTVSRAFDKLLSIAELDTETRKIYKLACPFVIEGLITGGAETTRVALVGRLIGTRAISAYVIVDLFIGLTMEFLGGFADALVTLLSHSIGTGNKKLTGEYVQISMILFVLTYIPFIFMWWFVIEDAVMLLGFDRETAEMGKSFAIPYLFAGLVHGLSRSVQNLLDCIDHEVMSTIIVGIGELCGTIAIFLVLYFVPGSTLQTVGVIYACSTLTAFVISILFIHQKGWIRRYYCGLFGSFALKVRSCELPRPRLV
jgi:hypothetical protein